MDTSNVMYLPHPLMKHAIHTDTPHIFHSNNHTFPLTIMYIYTQVEKHTCKTSFDGLHIKLNQLMYSLYVYIHAW